MISPSEYMPVINKDEHFFSVILRWAALDQSFSLFDRSSRHNSVSLKYFLKVDFLKKAMNSLPEFIDKKWFLINSSNLGYCATDTEINLFIGNKSEHKIVKQLYHQTSAQLRWCQLCAANDYSDFGYFFWRNSHQDPRLTRCPKHKLTLSSSCRFCNLQSPTLKSLKKFQSVINCSVCQSALVPPTIKKDLTPFQEWLEELHHLSRRRLLVSKEALFKKVNNSIGCSNLAGGKSWISAQKKFMQTYNDSGAFELFLVKKVEYEATKYYRELRVRDILRDPQKYDSPVVLALLAWTFLSLEERVMLFGSFKKVVC